MGGTADLSSGAIFANDFRVVRQLSSGGMGSVYVVEQLSTSKPRALKLMRPEIMTSAEQRRRFELEAKVGARIQSDHVVEVIGAGVEEATNTPWLAMELLSGQELAAYSADNGPLAPPTVGGLFEQICHAVGAAHEMQIVHRDLKPENIFLATSRRTGASFVVKILDFGIAKTLADARTKTTAAVGTPLWMAPEQTQPGSPILPAADVWALGLIAFRLLTGTIFWRSAQFDDASPMMILREVVMDPLPTASARAAELGGALLPAGFDDWFARCTDRDPTKRFANAREMYDAMPAVMRAASLEHAPTLKVRPSMVPSSGAQGSAQPPGPAITAPTPLPQSRTEVGGTEVGAPLGAPSRPTSPQTGSPAVITATPRSAPRGGLSTPFLAGAGAAVVITGIVGYLAFSAMRSGKAEARVEAANAEAITSVRPIASTGDVRPSSAPGRAPTLVAAPSAPAVVGTPTARPTATVSAKATATVEPQVPPKPPPTTPKPPPTTPKLPTPKPPPTDIYPV